MVPFCPESILVYCPEHCQCDTRDMIINLVNVYILLYMQILITCRERACKKQGNKSGMKTQEDYPQYGKWWKIRAKEPDLLHETFYATDVEQPSCLFSTIFHSRVVLFFFHLCLVCLLLLQVHRVHVKTMTEIIFSCCISCICSSFH